MLNDNNNNPNPGVPIITWYFVGSDAADKARYTNQIWTISGYSGGTGTGTIYSFSVPAPAANQGFAPNGNLLSFSDSVMGSWALKYDNLNRLTTGTVSSGTYNNLKLTGPTTALETGQRKAW